MIEGTGTYFRGCDRGSLSEQKDEMSHGKSCAHAFRHHTLKASRQVGGLYRRDSQQPLWLEWHSPGSRRYSVR